MPYSEGQRLQQSAVNAFRKASDAFRLNPQPGTPEWDTWQKLFHEAVAANDAYRAYSRANERKAGS